MVRINDRAVLDTVSGSSYASGRLSDDLKINPSRKEIKTIETLKNLTTKKLKIYSVKIPDVNEKCSFNTKLNKLEREVLLTLPNPHLKEVHMNGTDQREQLPAHTILGDSNFAKIKTEKSQLVGKIGEYFAELIKMDG